MALLIGFLPTFKYMAYFLTFFFALNFFFLATIFDFAFLTAILILKDKSPDVPNPIGREISVSLTDEFVDNQDD